MTQTTHKRIDAGDFRDLTPDTDADLDVLAGAIGDIMERKARERGRPSGFGETSARELALGLMRLVLTGKLQVKDGE